MLIDKIKFNYIKKFKNIHDSNINFISDFYNEITNIKVDDFLKDTVFLKKYLKQFKSIEISCRQYILLSFFNTYINHKFFKSKFLKTKLNFPILSCWKFFLIEKHGMSVNLLFSYFLLFLKILNSYRKFFFEVIKFLLNFKKVKINNFNQVLNISTENIPYNLDSNLKQYTFADWLIDNQNKDIVVTPKISKNFNYKNINIYFFKNIFFSSSKIIVKFNLLLKFLIIFLESLYFLCRRRITYSLILPEIVLYLIAKSKRSNEIAKQYYFSQADYIYRPLWTFPLEEKGSEIILYYYAASFDGYLEKNNYPKNEIGSDIMNWPKVLMYSEAFKEFKEKETKNSTFYKSPLIYFKDKKFDFEIPKNSVSIFDIMPYSYFAKSIEVPNTSYRSIANIFNFFEDILFISKKYDFKLVYKSHKDLENPKSYQGKHTRWNSRYTNFIKKLKNQIILVHYNVSEFKIIESTKFTISYPWTSTSIIADKLNKKSFFYDPTGELSNLDRGAQGIQLINKKEELDKMFSKLKSEM